MNSADIPMYIEPADDHGWRMARIAVIVAVLTSSGWAYLLNEERAAHQQQLIAERAANDLLLAEAVARMTPIQSLTIGYTNGAKATVTIKEAQQ